jgi:hypothetical protein
MAGTRAQSGCWFDPLSLQKYNMLFETCLSHVICAYKLKEKIPTQSLSVVSKNPILTANWRHVN